MTDVIQHGLATLRAAEWLPVTAARILIGIFFCICGGTKLLGRGQFAPFEKTMVQIGVPFPRATALFVATVEFACGAGLALGLLTPLCAAMLTADMIVATPTVAIHTIHARGLQ
jgi:putative oxidoreductase